MITTVGIDLAKNVFQIHGIDGHGKAVLRKKLDRSKMLDAGIFYQLTLRTQERRRLPVVEWLEVQPWTNSAWSYTRII